jgi:4-hydroxyphenylpyruvate dioxygenase-like putative hemolysin
VVLPGELLDKYRQNGIHHLAISTGDMKAQLEFFT